MRIPLLCLAVFVSITPSCLEDSSSDAQIQDLKDEIYELKEDAAEQAKKKRRTNI